MGKKIANYVLLGSKTGLYGGPFETSSNQVIIASQFGCDAKLYYGVFDGDQPEVAVPHEAHLLWKLSRQRSYFWLTSFSQMRSGYTASSADIVHVSLARGIGPLAVSIFTLVRGGKLIVQTHGMLTSRESLLHDLYDACFTRPVLKSASKIIALTSVEERELQSKFPEVKGKVAVIGNPPSQLEQTLVPEVSLDMSGPPKILFAARLHKRKRVLDFAMAAKEANRRGWKDWYQVYGPDEGDLTQLLTVSEELPNFHYAGKTDAQGVLEAIRVCDIFVLPSENEPWGNALVSAISLSKPVVVTRSSHLSSLIEEYSAGIVVPDGNPVEIAIACHQISDSETYKRFARGAHRLARQEFSMEKYLSALRETYLE